MLCSSWVYLGHPKDSHSKIIFFPLWQVLHPQSMRPAREGNIPVRVKNSYNPNAPGTLITRTRDMSKVCNNRLLLTVVWMTPTSINFSFLQLQAVLTSIVLKRNITMLDIVSTRMLGQYGFLAKVRKLMKGALFPELSFLLIK